MPQICFQQINSILMFSIIKNCTDNITYLIFATSRWYLMDMQYTWHSWPPYLFPVKQLAMLECFYGRAASHCQGRVQLVKHQYAKQCHCHKNILHSEKVPSPQELASQLRTVVILLLSLVSVCLEWVSEQFQPENPHSSI